MAQKANCSGRGRPDTGTAASLQRWLVKYRVEDVLAGVVDLRRPSERRHQPSRRHALGLGVVGIVFMVFVLFFPRGLWGTVLHQFERWQRRQGGAA